jgi:transcription elongation factor Elf1
MFISVHVPMFGSANIDSKPINCPYCPPGTNDWQQCSLEVCNPGDKLQCSRCGKEVTINWGLTEPDHLSAWLNSEHCPHHLCEIKYKELKAKEGWG